MKVKESSTNTLDTMDDTTIAMDETATPHKNGSQDEPATQALQSGTTPASGVTDWQKTCPTHKERFVYLLDSGINSDVILLVGKNEIPFKAHKLILSTGSPVFQNLLSGTHPAAEIFIKDVEPKPFRLLLNFLYTGETEAEVNDAPALLYAANKFQVPDLVTLCALLLKTHLSDKNAASIYQQAERFDQHELADSALVHIRRHARNVLETEDFLSLSTNVLCRLLEDDELEAADEMQVYEAVLRWAKAQCKRDGQQVSPTNLRQSLKDVIPHIRFPQMDCAEFALRVAKKGILTNDELVPIFMYFTIPESQRGGILPSDFNLSPRKYYEPSGRTFVVNRFAVGSNYKRTDGGWDRIGFTVDTPMWVVAFAVNCFSTSRGENPKQRKLSKGNSCEVEIRLEDSSCQTLFGSKKESLAYLEAPYYCEFDKPVRIAPNTHYVASVFVQGPNLYCYAGEREKTASVVQADDVAVNFKFQDANVVDDEATASMKQLHEITFMLT